MIRTEGLSTNYSLHTFFLEDDHNATSARRHWVTVEDEFARHIGAAVCAVVNREKVFELGGKRREVEV